ncbi:hypothetical protein AZF37_00980 [endosymbiont 'TC1' of Trimyema compressum]|nr:hypothetical protein AZF37_00980 [endosymbiont 'TC1' of Trimyema compressum]
MSAASKLGIHIKKTIPKCNIHRYANDFNPKTIILLLVILPYALIILIIIYNYNIYFLFFLINK